MSYSTVNYEVETPVNFLERSALVFPEKTAVVYDDQRYTYREFSNRVNQLASGLKKAGVGSGQ